MLISYNSYNQVHRMRNRETVITTVLSSAVTLFHHRPSLRLARLSNKRRQSTTCMAHKHPTIVVRGRHPTLSTLRGPSCQHRITTEYASGYPAIHVNENGVTRLRHVANQHQAQ